ncbi:MAG: CocE/NonD family hydrolase [Chloroflexota bacterium]
MTATAPAAITLAGQPGVTVEYGLTCPMRDGVDLMTDVYRPADAAGDLPVILMRLPYDKTMAENIAYAHPSWYCRQGYLVAIQDCRGRWASGGEWHPFRDEASDGEDAIAWAAALPGSSGKVGMYGFSYAGATQLLPAVRRPPALAAICPAMTGANYGEGWTYSGGALNLAFVASWALDLAGSGARGRGDMDEAGRLAAAFNALAGHFHELPLKRFSPLSRKAAPWFFDWLDNPTPGDYWDQWSIELDYARVAVPGLHIGGWYDVFLGGTVRNYAGLAAGAGSASSRETQKLVIGPWYHMPWQPLGAPGEPADHTVVDELQVAWFDRYLKGRQTPTRLPDTPVLLYLMGDDRWRGFDSWPPPGSTPTPFFLHSAGRANSASGDGALSAERPGAQPPDVYTYSPVYPNYSQGGDSCCYPHVSPMGPADQGPAEAWNSLLCYTGAPLDRDLYVAGDCHVTLFAASSARDTDWAARLCVVDPAGVSTNLKNGIIRARYRDGFAAPALLEPHRVYEYRIDLGPVGARIPAGSRIRLDIASSDFPLHDRNLNTGGPLFEEDLSAAVIATQSVLHDADHPSCLWLPVMPAPRD